MNPGPSIPPHGGQLRQIAERFGVAADSLLDLSANINPAGPPDSAVTAIRRALEDPASLTIYPDLESVKLKQTIAKYIGVEAENISIANGFAPLLDATLRSLEIKRCLLPVPCFGEYRRTLELAKAIAIPYQLSSVGDFVYEADAILKSAIAHSCDAILLANPQNPSGVVCDPGYLLHLAEMAIARNILLLVDEAFVDYCPGNSIIKKAVERPNIIVFRSVTKFFAIPGLRVAYAASHASFAKKLNWFISPWPVTDLAADAACAALMDTEYAERSRTANEQRRSRLERELMKHGIAAYPSSTNFLLLRFPETVDVLRLWERMILEQRIVLRLCANFEGLEPNHLRVAVRTEQENKRLAEALGQVLSS